MDNATCCCLIIPVSVLDVIHLALFLLDRMISDMFEQKKTHFLQNSPCMSQAIAPKGLTISVYFI